MQKFIVLPYIEGQNIPRKPLRRILEVNDDTMSGILRAALPLWSHLTGDDADVPTISLCDQACGDYDITNGSYMHLFLTKVD